VDDEEDYGLPIWAGTLNFAPLSTTPKPDPRLASGSGPGARAALSAG